MTILTNNHEKIHKIKKNPRDDKSQVDLKEFKTKYESLGPYNKVSI